jgi:uncharacterized protein (TIGR03435 family)
MVKILPVPVLVFITTVALAQTPTFEVATVKLNSSRLGGDGAISIDPGRFSARHATLKELIFEAYQVPYSRITGGPSWIDFDEFDVEAKSEAPAAPAQVRAMLKTLLTDRFSLRLRSVPKEGSVYVLTVDRGGSKLKKFKAGDPPGNSPAPFRFVSDLAEFADRLSTMLTIPLESDPTKPSMARGTPTPVLDRTGLAGTYDIAVSPKAEPGDDAFAMWQRTLREQLGLRLEAQKAQVDTLVIDRADRVLPQN